MIHLAAFKAVGESAARPLMYYDNNVGGSVSLFDAFEAAGGGAIVFVVGHGLRRCRRRTFMALPVQPTNPYGQTKAMMEQVLADMVRAPGARSEGWRCATSTPRVPTTAPDRGRPKDQPNNLFPIIVQVAVGQRES